MSKEFDLTLTVHTLGGEELQYKGFTLKPFAGTDAIGEVWLDWQAQSDKCGVFWADDISSLIEIIENKLKVIKDY